MAWRGSRLNFWRWKFLFAGVFQQAGRHTKVANVKLPRWFRLSDDFIEPGFFVVRQRAVDQRIAQAGKFVEFVVNGVHDAASAID